MEKRAEEGGERAAAAAAEAFGVHPDDFARKGTYTPEKVCSLLSCMAWDRRLKDLGLCHLHDVRRCKQALAEFPGVLKQLAVRAATAKEKASKAEDLFSSLKAQVRE